MLNPLEEIRQLNDEISNMETLLFKKKKQKRNLLKRLKAEFDLSAFLRSIPVYERTSIFSELPKVGRKCMIFDPKREKEGGLAILDFLCMGRIPKGIALFDGVSNKLRIFWYKSENPVSVLKLIEISNE